MSVSFKVDFIGIGSGKCGSTWLYENLVKHPRICNENLKELNYFSDLYDEQSFEWYRRQYCECDDTLLKGEFSVTYLAHPLAPARVKQHFPNARLLAIIREPVRRTFSNYLHAIRKAVISPKVSFATYIADEANLLPARYDDHFEHWLQEFPREQIHVVILETFLEDQLVGYRELFDFLGVDPSFVPPGYAERSNEARSYRFLWVENILVRTYWFLSRRGYTRLVKRIVDSRVGELVRWWNASAERDEPKIDDASRKTLAAYYRPHNARLAAHLGLDLTAWNHPDLEPFESRAQVGMSPNGR